MEKAFDREASYPGQALKIFSWGFQGAEKEAGQIGLTIVILGMAGSICAGWILDKTHAFKYVH